MRINYTYVARHTWALLLAGSALLTATASLADTFYWKGDSFGLYDELTNWSTESTTGADAERLPTATDTLFGPAGYNLDLNNGNWELKNWDIPGGDWNNYSLQLQNGTLTFVSSVCRHSGRAKIGEGGKLVIGENCTFTPALNDAGTFNVEVLSGGEFELLGHFACYHGSITVSENAIATLNPKSWGGHAGSTQSNNNIVNNGGVLNAPKGLVWERGGGSRAYTANFNQNAGTLNLGGPISYETFKDKMAFTINFNGGIVNITSNAYFLADTINLKASVPFVVSAGATLDASGMQLADGVTLMKQGSGAIAFRDDLPASLSLEAGDIYLTGTNTTYTAKSMTLPEGGANVYLKGTGMTLEGTFDEGLTFIYDETIPHIPGDVIVTTSDTALLNRIANEIITPDAPLEIEGNSIVFTTPIPTFNSTTITDLNNPDGWNTGIVPEEDSTVIIKNAHALVNADQPLPPFGTIMLAGTATLQIAGTTAEGTAHVLPYILLNKATAASIIIGDESGTATKAQINSYKSNVDITSTALPRLVVQKGATLYFPGNTKLSNLAVEHYGKISRADNVSGGLTIGYAPAGETTLIAYTSDGGVFDYHSNEQGIMGLIAFVSPAANGRVKVVGNLYLKGTQFPPTGWNDFGERWFGKGNPLDEPFNVIFDGVYLPCCWSIYVSGAANMQLINGSRIEKWGSAYNHWYRSYIQDAAKITICDTSSFDYTAGDGYLSVDGGSESIVTVRDGGSWCPAQVTGKKNAQFVSEDGCIVVGKRGGSGFAALGTGFREINIPAEKTLSITSKNTGVSPAVDWDRHIAVAAIPLTGAGDVIVRHAYTNRPFTVRVPYGANTCTGSIRVEKPEEGSAQTALFFDNGANWAGTVISTGFTAITNTASATETTLATVTFNNLHLQEGALTIRSTRDEGSQALALDQINLLGSIIKTSTDKGFVQITGEAFTGSDKPVLGTAPAGAWTGVEFRDADNRRLNVLESAPDPDTGRVTVTITRSMPTTIYIY